MNALVHHLGGHGRAVVARELVGRRRLGIER
jgi:hypothetical protein